MTNYLDPLPEKLTPMCPPDEAYQSFTLFYQDLLDLKMKNQLSEWGLRKAIQDICKHLGYYHDELLAYNTLLRSSQYVSEKETTRKSGF